MLIGKHIVELGQITGDGKNAGEKFSFDKADLSCGLLY